NSLLRRKGSVTIPQNTEGSGSGVLGRGFLRGRSRGRLLRLYDLLYLSLDALPSWIAGIQLSKLMQEPLDLLYDGRISVLGEPEDIFIVFVDDEILVRHQGAIFRDVETPGSPSYGGAIL